MTLRRRGRVEATGAEALASVEVAAVSTAVAVVSAGEADFAVAVFTAAECGWAAVDALSALGPTSPVHFHGHRLEAAGHMHIADMRAAGRA